MSVWDMAFLFGMVGCLVLEHRNMRKSFFPESAVLQWHGLPTEVVESLSLEVFKKRVDVALRDIVSGHGGEGLTFGQDNVSGLFQP